MYSQGEGLEKNQAEAVRWFHRSANQGNTDAQCNLALVYGLGEGVKLDQIEALKWMYLAAERGANSIVEMRDAAAGQLTPAQITEAKRRANEFVVRKET